MADRAFRHHRKRTSGSQAEEETQQVRSVQRELTLSINEVSYLTRNNIAYDSLGLVSGYTDSTFNPIDNSKTIVQRDHMLYDSLGSLLSAWLIYLHYYHEKIRQIKYKKFKN